MHYTNLMDLSKPLSYCSHQLLRHFLFEVYHVVVDDKTEQVRAFVVTENNRLLTVILNDLKNLDCLLDVLALI